MGWKKEPVKRYGGEDPQAKQQRLNQAYRYAKMNKTTKPNLELILMGMAGFSVAAAVMLVIFIICKNLSM
jgi:hypothetical protein